MSNYLISGVDAVLIHFLRLFLLLLIKASTDKITVAIDFILVVILIFILIGGLIENHDHVSSIIIVFVVVGGSL